MGDEPHVCFTASPTAYLRSLDPDDMHAWAVHYQKSPLRHDDGRTSYSLNFPTLIVTAYLQDQEAIAKRVADILNKHWDHAHD